MITAVGETLVDLVRTADGEERAHPGGSAANVALGLARLDTPVTLLTRIGRDPHGGLLRARLEASGVVLAPGAGAVAALVATSRETATVSYDPNCRPALMGDPASARRRVEGFVALSDVVKVSDEDLDWLCPGEAPADVARRWLRLGPALVVVTRGERGAYAVARGRRGRAPGAGRGRRRYRRTLPAPPLRGVTPQRADTLAGWRRATRRTRATPATGPSATPWARCGCRPAPSGGRRPSARWRTFRSPVSGSSAS